MGVGGGWRGRGVLIGQGGMGHVILLTESLY